MTHKHIMFPEIGQFRSTVKKVTDRALDALINRPTINFTGSCKLHGTNAAVSCGLTDTADYWTQSREHIITPTKDNAGFASFVKSEEAYFKLLLANAAQIFVGDSKPDSILSIFGEWCGGNVQKADIAISNLPKMFVVFGVSVSSGTTDAGETIHNWFDKKQIELLMKSRLLRTDGAGASAHLVTAPTTIKCIYDFQTWEISIDFANPELSQNQLGEWTMAVEKQCPVGAALGVTGVGEGIVWVAFPSKNPNAGVRLDDLIFKVKGEKHSSSKVTTLAAVDIEKVGTIKAFVESVLTDSRLNQGMQLLRSKNPEVSVKQTGDFIKWVSGDVVKEESDTIATNNLDMKDVMPAVSKAAREWFIKEVNKVV